MTYPTDSYAAGFDAGIAFNKTKVETLQARVADAERMQKYYSDYCNLTAVERDVALAKLKELEAQPEPEELTDAELLTILVSIDPDTKRLPSGFRDFARAVLAAAKGGAL